MSRLSLTVCRRPCVFSCVQLARRLLFWANRRRLASTGPVRPVYGSTPLAVHRRAPSRILGAPCVGGYQPRSEPGRSAPADSCANIQRTRACACSQRVCLCVCVCVYLCDNRVLSSVLRRRLTNLRVRALPQTRHHYK